MKRFFVFIILSIFALPLAGADALRDYMEEQTAYWGVRKTVSAADLDQLTDLKRKAEQAGLTPEERTKAYTDLFQFAQKLRGLPVGKVPGALAAGYWSAGESPVAPQLPSAKRGQLGNFQKHGTGKTAMILIPDIGADRTVFDSFMKRNESLFTFYAVTLPGFGGTDAPARPDHLDFGTTDWWNNAANAVLNLVKKEKLDRPLVLGHQAGAYLAMKLALQHPELFRGSIVLNGLLYASLPGITQNSATHEERVRIVNSWTPVELFPNTSKTAYLAMMMQNASWFCKQKECQERMARLMAGSSPAVWWNYFAELATTDLSAEVKSLKLPMLVLPSMYDRDSPGVETSKTNLAQWTPLDHSASSLPITVIQMQDCRAYATEDQPEKLDEVIRNWTGKL